MKQELTAMQENFCREYTSAPKKNATRAAIRAGYSEKGAAVEASRFLRNPNILRRIKELEREALEEAGYNPESLRSLIMRNLVSIATADAADLTQVIYEESEHRKAALEQLADENGGQLKLDFGEPVVYVKPTSEWTPEERAVVKSIKPGKYGVEIEIYDKHAALKTLAEIVGITKQSVELTGPGGQAVELNLVFGGSIDGLDEIA